LLVRRKIKSISEGGFDISLDTNSYKLIRQRVGAGDAPSAKIHKISGRARYERKFTQSIGPFRDIGRVRLKTFGITDASLCENQINNFMLEQLLTNTFYISHNCNNSIFYVHIYYHLN
jgi:hypothetical protein